jgi:hypothetical protein
VTQNIERDLALGVGIYGTVDLSGRSAVRKAIDDASRPHEALVALAAPASLTAAKASRIRRAGAKGLQPSDPFGNKICAVHRG